MTDSEQKTYRNPPIAEAIIQISLAHNEGFNVEDYNDFHKVIKDNYPEKQEVKEAELRIGDSPNFSTTVCGYRFLAPEKTDILTLNQDYFSFASTRDYTCWDDFIEQPKKLWSDFRSTFSDAKKLSLSVRYINEISLPSAALDFDDYLISGPSVPRDLPQVLNNFLLRLELPAPEVKGVCLVTQTLGKPKADNISLILDIDVITKIDIPEDDDSMWKLFKELRNQKNKFFEAFITDKTRGLF